MAMNFLDMLSAAKDRAAGTLRSAATSYGDMRNAMGGNSTINPETLEPTAASRVGQTIRNATLKGAETLGDLYGRATGAMSRAGSTAGQIVQASQQAADPAPQAAAGGAQPPFPRVAGAPDPFGGEYGGPQDPYAEYGTGAKARVAPPPSTLSKAATAVGRVAGKLAVPATVGLEAYDAAQNLSAGENPLKSVGRASLRAGGTLLGGALGATAGTLAGPVGTVAGGAAGGAAGYNLADKASEYLFGPEKRKEGQALASNGGATPSSAYAGSDGVTPQPAVQPRPDSALPQSNLSSDRGNADVPAEGTGSIRRTTPGNEGKVVAVGQAGSDSLAGATAQSESLRNGSPRIAQPVGSERADSGYNQPSAIQHGAPRDAQGRPAPAGAPAGSQSTAASNSDTDQYGLRRIDPIPAPRYTTLATGTGGKVTAADRGREEALNAAGQYRAALRNQKTQIEARGQDATVMNNRIMRQIQLDQIAYQRGQDNERRLGEQAEQHVREKMEAVTPGTLKNADTGAYKENVAKETAAFKNRINFSLQDSGTGKTLQNLSQPEFQQLRLLDKARDAVVNARSGTFQSLRDMFGQKRFDSNNLYSYAPTSAEPSVQGGYLIHFRNGNTAHVKEVAGGRFQLLGPNEPVDADTMALIRPAIEAAKRSRGR